MQTTIHITLNRILTQVAERQATDLHLTVGSRPMIRVATDLISMNEEEVVTKDFIIGVIDTVLNEDQQRVLGSRREVIFSYNFGDRARFRVDAFYQKDYPSLVFHYIPTSIKPLAELGLPNSLEDLTKQNSGLVLVGGPYGSGKTTTLMGFLETINRNQKKHILTLEQPIEYVMVGNQSLVEQKEIGGDVESWIEAMDIMEEDVDVLMLGQAVSTRVVEKVLKLADSGLLVYLPMEGNSIGEVLHHVIDSCAVENRDFCRYLLAKTFRGAVVQKRLPKIAGGTVLALEIIFGSQVIASAIKDNKLSQLATVLQSGREEGMISLDRYLVELVKSGQVDKKIAITEANNPEDIKRLLNY